jgi:hypothetical protein
VSIVGQEDESAFCADPQAARGAQQRVDARAERRMKENRSYDR